MDWNAAALEGVLKEYFPGKQLVLVTSREPYVHRRTLTGIHWTTPAGGVTSALDPLMQATGGIWVAWGSGNADMEAVDENGCIEVPPQNPSYTLRRVWLSQKQVEGFYLGFSNQSLWPLCHMLMEKARFRRAYWEKYVEANSIFTQAALQHAKAGDVVWVHDYQLTLCPRFIKMKRPDLLVSYFWHIPWPEYGVWRACPQAAEILKGILGADVIGFHTQDYCEHFLNCVKRELGADVDKKHGMIHYQGKTSMVRAFPIGVDFERFDSMARSPQGQRLRNHLRKKYGFRDEHVVISVDRLDYTKGIPQKVDAVDLFLSRNPLYRGNFVLLMVAVPSRTQIDAYASLRTRVKKQVEEINHKYSTGEWSPIIYIDEKLDQEELTAHYQLCGMAIVSPLLDGMNLVAKEFIASKVSEKGILLLSKFAGAYEEMPNCIPVNPYDPEEFAQNIKRGLEMPLVEKKMHMKAMREHLRKNNIYKWMADIFEETRKTALRHSVFA